MRRFVLFAAVTLAVGACAPSSPAAGPSATPAARPPSAAPATAVSRTATLRVPATAPDDWWHLDAATDGIPGISAVRAYRELLAGREPQRTVVVAIIDSGVDIAHADLRDNLWVNPGEVPGSGRDDDGNGYVDDVHGWNFIGGPDGRHVAHDTYEVTRLYTALRGRYEGARADTLSAAARADYDLYRRVRSDFETMRSEATRQLQQIREIESAVTHVTGLLQSTLGTDSLTVEAVSALRPTRSDLRQAQSIYLAMAADNITPKMIREQREFLETRLEYHLNPRFDSRDIVGDDYANPRERHYGNADVIGPDARHGTHVAGIVGALRGNGLGIDGIAPAVRLMVLRTVPDGDERDKDVANAIRYAADNGAHIINMSFGKGYSPEKRVVDEAVRHADSLGVLMITGAGNDGADLASKPSFPTPRYDDGGSARHWLAVGATAWWGADSLAASFSNYGREQVHVFAPGVDVLSTVPGNEYERLSGTSMAAPVVAGLAALLMAYYPELSTAEVRQIILDSATRYADLRVARPGGNGGRVAFCQLSVTCGVVNAYEAVRMAEARSPAGVAN